MWPVMVKELDLVGRECRTTGSGVGDQGPGAGDCGSTWSHSLRQALNEWFPMLARDSAGRRHFK